MSTMFKDIVGFIREIHHQPEAFIPLHAPVFNGREKEYVNETIDSTFVSSVGSYVDLFEEKMKELTGAGYAVAVVNGTSALHMALKLVGVAENDLVITQPLTFVATCNAISYEKAYPLFTDIERHTLGMDPVKLAEYLESNAEVRDDGFAYHVHTGRRIKACVPMHTFGHPVSLDELLKLCNDWNISLIEDAAESVGSYYKGQHTGALGKVSAFSLNGNKIITSGGGGALVTSDEELGKLAKHLTTQAKVPHSWHYEHDHVGYNYRMPNLNAALACAQLEELDGFLEDKRELAGSYGEFFDSMEVPFIREPGHGRSNYWLNAILLESPEQREDFLEYTNEHGVMTRPVWKLMNRLSMFRNAEAGNLDQAAWIEDRLVNIPSSVRLKK